MRFSLAGLCLAFLLAAPAAWAGAHLVEQSGHAHLPGRHDLYGPFVLSESHASFRAIACNGVYASAVQTYSYTITL